MTGKRHLLGGNRDYLNAVVPQSRFILFLLIVLVVYTLLLKVFQKLAELVQLPVFFPIALLTLLFFVGVVGVMYFHAFVGPMLRIRRALELLAEGDADVSLRLRDSDDPLLKDFVKAITRLCEHSRSSHALIQEAARDLFADIEALREKVRQGADKADIQKHVEGLRAKRELLEKAITSYGKT